MADNTQDKKEIIRSWALDDAHNNTEPIQNFQKFKSITSALGIQVEPEDYTFYLDVYDNPNEYWTKTDGFIDKNNDNDDLYNDIIENSNKTTKADFCNKVTDKLLELMDLVEIHGNIDDFDSIKSLTNETYSKIYALYYKWSQVE